MTERGCKVRQPLCAGLLTSVLALAALRGAAAQEEKPAAAPPGDKSAQAEVQPMKTDNRALEKVIRTLAKDVEGADGQWTFRVNGVEVLVLTSEPHNRMRVIAPVVDAGGLTRSDLLKMMKANFDRALDAKYTVWKGKVWAAFVHPLAELTKAEFESALKQVVALKKNYGTTYSSTDLVFAGGDDLEEDESDEKPVPEPQKNTPDDKPGGNEKPSQTQDPM